MVVAASKRMPTLRRRADFKRLSKGLRRSFPAFNMQAAPAGEVAGRFGLTVTRKVGTATERNRIKRRLRAAIGLLERSPIDSAPVDCVIVARRECLNRDFQALGADIAAGLAAACKKIAIRAL